MKTVSETNQAQQRPLLRVILLLLAILTSPLACCGGSFLLDALPASVLPPVVSFMTNLFEAEARVENRTGETFYLTPMTTTTGQPKVIAQTTFIRQRDFPLQPNRSIVLTYDAADLPLSGIAVCRANDDCRLLVADHSEIYYLDSFENLPRLEADWLLAIRSHPQNNFGLLLFPLLGLIPVVLFLAWLAVCQSDKQRAGLSGVG